MKIILGIDPGSRIAGYGLITFNDKKPHYLASGVIRLEDESLQQRLVVLHTSVNQLLAEYNPVEAAIEKVFVGKSADSALKLGQARGVALLALAQANIAVHEYAPRSIKHTVTGSGSADKQQMIDMVVRTLNLDAAPSADAADALAIALCHAYSANFQSALNAQKQKYELGEPG